MFFPYFIFDFLLSLFFSNIRIRTSEQKYEAHQSNAEYGGEGKICNDVDDAIF